MSGSVVELAQYTLHPGRRESLVEVFDRWLGEGQEAAGMCELRLEPTDRCCGDKGTGRARRYPADLVSQSSSAVRVHNFSVSLDGFATGEGQSFDEPFGHAGTTLHEWAFPTRTFRRLFGEEGGSAGVDEAFAGRWADGIGAEIMGRGKFGPQTGPWSDHAWRGWWGDEPPFHTPVFVLTHHLRPPLEMDGGTTFTFLDAGPAEALAAARAAAGGLDVRIGGGPSTIRNFLAADLVDYLHVVVVPIVLGRGVRLWDGLESLEARFDVEATSSPSGVTHLSMTRR